MKFIDLFAGLGGFHQGLVNAGGFECVFASEIDESLREIYANNHGLSPHGDITKVHESSVPEHDVLCAGFPCQPFSLAGSKKGAKCPESGKLINDIIRIAEYRRPNFLMLENVPNVLTIENGSFWHYIKSSFEGLGYKIIHKVISPDEVGIPQNRKRLFIVGSLDHQLLDCFEWPLQKKEKTLEAVIEKKIKRNHKRLEDGKRLQLEHWQRLLIDCGLKTMPPISLCAPEFGATYPLDFHNLRVKDMQNYKGAYGKSLKDCKSWSEVMMLMPSYVQKNKAAPEWMLESVEYSRSFYRKHKRFLNSWHKNLQKENNSWQILEWRGHRDYLNFDRHLIQFRASGIRIIRAVRAPSLISMTPTQIPIVGSQMRYLSKHEAAKLQNLHKLKSIPKNDTRAFKAFGNAVNAKVVELIAKKLIKLQG
ncbi:DNA cytosine methyltransferase [Pseudoteredinibacter isoporae]|uniref:DNA cytosine methyltransferase n=1 Tax=Pseudoteredinibacter isoporae TaxID=570281 RepID=UPI003342A5A3